MNDNTIASPYTAIETVMTDTGTNQSLIEQPDFLSDSSDDDTEPQPDGTFDFHSLLARTYASIEAERAKNPQAQCTCEPWIPPQSRKLCPDLRTCRYVKNVRAVQGLREQSERRIAFTCTKEQIALVADSATATLDAAHFTLIIPQSSSTMNDGAGWTIPGGGDATGNVLWPASIFTCKMIQAICHRRTASSRLQKLPFFDTHTIHTIELGCGSALISMFLSLMSHPQSTHIATDQNTVVATDLQKRVKVRVGGGEASSQHEQIQQQPQGQQLHETSVDPYFTALFTLLQSRLSRFSVLPFEWSTPLLSTAALRTISIEDATQHCHVPELIIGADLVYFSIAYPKLVESVWDLFENYLFTHSMGMMKGWMGKASRRGRQVEVHSNTSKTSSTSYDNGASPLPLLFLAHKCRHGETEQELFLALSQFSWIWKLKREFVQHLQDSSSKDGMSESVTSSSSYPTFPIDPLPLDCFDPFLEFYFIVPKIESQEEVTESSHTTGSATSDTSTGSDLGQESWTPMLASALKHFESAPSIVTGSEPHWFIGHLPSGAIESWMPKDYSTTIGFATE